MKLGYKHYQTIPDSEGDNNKTPRIMMMKRIYFSLPIDEDTNMVLQMTIEEIKKQRIDSISVDVTMEQLIEFRNLLDEVIDDIDKSNWL